MDERSPKTGKIGRVQRRKALAELRLGDALFVAGWTLATNSLSDAMHLRRTVAMLRATLVILDEGNRIRRTGSIKKAVNRPKKTKGKKPALTAAQIRCIFQEIDDGVSLAQSASSHGVTERYLRRRLKEFEREEGTRPRSLRRLAGDRLLWAKRQLAAGRLPRDIAETLGVKAVVLERVLGEE